MTNAASRCLSELARSHQCISVFDSSGEAFTLRYVWVISVSALDAYLTELVSEAGLRIIDKDPATLTENLAQVGVPLEGVLSIGKLDPTERFVYFREQIFRSIQFKSFYRPDKVSEALSYIWRCPPKEKWARILSRMNETGRYVGRTEKDIRDELSLIGDRRDLIAHAIDTPPGTGTPNTPARADAVQVLTFISDMVAAIDRETEAQLA